MMAGRLARLVRTAFIPCPLLCLAAACASSARINSTPHDDATLTEASSASNPVLHARLYALGQELSQEQQRNAALQEQLDARGQQVEQLRTEVQELRDYGTAGGLAAGSPAAESPAAVPVEADVTSPAEPAPATSPEGASPLPAVESAAATTAPAPQPPADRSADAGSALTPALVPGTESASTAPSDTVASTVSPQAVCSDEMVASLRTALSQEQERREAAETQLARLKEETSAPPYGRDVVSAADYAAAKQEIVELRQMLDDERAQREHLAQELGALQQRAALDGAPQADASQDDATRSRLQRLQTERDAAVDNLKQSLDASERRGAALEKQLAATPAGSTGAAGVDGSPDGDVASVRAENAALRTRLDEEHRHTEELANKLKVASRVTDLIFKMQAQQAAPASAPAPAMEMR